MRDNKWARLLAYITGLVNQRLLLQCEYPLAENECITMEVTDRDGNPPKKTVLD
jgi:hypothetical protein